MAGKDCLEWLQVAKRDILAAQQLFEQQQNPRHRPIEIILYHCQQGAEKALKAFVVEQGNFPPKTHDLNALRMLCGESCEKFNSRRLAGHCAFLNQFSAAVRYPYHNLNLDSAETKRALNSVKRVYGFVQEILGLEQEFV